jgi:uncharacterized protein (TIGR03382 family)
MSRTRTCVLALAIALCATSSYSYAGYLDADTSAYAGWHGTSTFDNGLSAPDDLKGYIEWAVYAPGNWPSTFTYNIALDTSQLLYTYQIFSEGNDPVTLKLTPINGPGQDAGYFTGSFASASVDGEIPTSAFVGSFAFAAWTFDGLVGPETSKGLMFTSPNVPEFSSSLVQDGGGSTIAQDVPAPSPVPIPEPGTATLALGGLCGLVLVWLRRRRSGVYA